MRLSIRGQAAVLPGPLKSHIERRVRLALGRFGTALTLVAVRIEDLNGPRGGNDKLCTIEARLGGTTPVVVEETASGLRESFDRALERLGRSVERVVQRRLSARRGLPARAKMVSESA